MNLKSKLKKIEERLGFSEIKQYLFIHSHIPSPDGENTLLYQKDNFRGEVFIIEGCGNEMRSIDSASEEGRKILLEKGYKETCEGGAG